MATTKNRDIAKKVIVNTSYLCPHCGSAEVFTDTGDSYVDYPLKRCQNCGGLLDWSNTEWSDRYDATL